MQAQPRQRTHQQALPASKVVLDICKALQHVPCKATPEPSRGSKSLVCLTLSIPLHLESAARHNWCPVALCAYLHIPVCICMVTASEQSTAHREGEDVNSAYP